MHPLRTLGLCCALAVLPAGAHAHAHLLRAVPADGSVLHGAPARVVLTFSEAARLMALWIAPAAGAREKISALPVDAAAEITVVLPPLRPGSYVITWRAVGRDGHLVPGELHFTVAE